MNPTLNFILFMLVLSTVFTGSQSIQAANNNTIRCRKLLQTHLQTVGGGQSCLRPAFSNCAAPDHFPRFTDQLVPSAGEQSIDSTTHPVGNWVNADDSTGSARFDDRWSLLISLFSCIVSISVFVLILLLFIVLSAFILWPVFLCWQLLGLFLLYNPDIEHLNFVLPKLLSFVVRITALL